MESEEMESEEIVSTLALLRHGINSEFVIPTLNHVLSTGLTFDICEIESWYLSTGMTS